MAYLVVNNGACFLDGAINDSQTSIGIKDATPTLTVALSSVSASSPLLLTIDNDTNVEIVKVTAHNAGTLTVERGIDGTVALAFADNVKAEARMNRELVNDIKNASIINAIIYG